MALNIELTQVLVEFRLPYHTNYCLYSQNQDQTNVLIFIIVLESSKSLFSLNYFPPSYTSFVLRIMTTCEYKPSLRDFIPYTIFCGAFGFLLHSIKKIISKQCNFLELIFVDFLIDFPPCFIIFFINNIHLCFQCCNNCRFILVFLLKQQLDI